MKLLIHQTQARGDGWTGLGMEKVRSFPTYFFSSPTFLPLGQLEPVCRFRVTSHNSSVGLQKSRVKPISKFTLGIIPQWFNILGMITQGKVT